MNIIIREEKTSDYASVSGLIEEAFRGMEHSDNREHFLVERLRKSVAFIPELALVAEVENEIVGHILLTKITIVDGDKSSESLALAPVSVLPRFQGRGIGGKLIKEAHKRAEDLNFSSVILVGNPHYYQRFGYKPAADYKISLPFEGVEEYSMAIELTENALQNAGGKVEYPKEFYE